MTLDIDINSMDVPLIAIIGLLIAIGGGIYNYWYASRLWGMHEDCQRRQREGLAFKDAERETIKAWPWWRIR